MLIRKPSVAGSFYPSEASSLREYFHSRLIPSPKPLAARAVILPHAGYVYSGETASRVLSSIPKPETVLLIGPNHRGESSEFAVYPEGKWETPLGCVQIDGELTKALLSASHEIKSDEAAHRNEHSLEVLVPFLQTLNPQVRIVPLLIGTLDFDRAAKVAGEIGKLLAARPEVLIAVSTDMSHYYPDEVARKKDRYALDAIGKFDADRLVAEIHAHAISMCGMVPVYMLLKMKNALGLRRVKLMDYRTSADASGDTNRVVGYAGFIFE